MAKRYTITIDDDLDNAISVLANENKVSKSKIINEAIKMYLNRLASNELEKDLKEELEDIKKELNRYNTLLVKNSLYTIATRQHLANLHIDVVKNKDKVLNVADKTWNIAVDKLKEQIEELE